LARKAVYEFLAIHSFVAHGPHAQNSLTHW
jgi:hypothetical protein